MNIRELTAKEMTQIYNSYMIFDFPKSELKPLARILSTMSDGFCHAFGLFDGETLKGYSIFIIPNGHSYALLDYFAILYKYRGCGIGHEFFSTINDFFNCHFPQLDGIYIECESITTANDENERITRTRRIAFYENCGCKNTRLSSNLFGVEYSILLFPLTASLNEDFLTDKSYDTLDFIYKKMFRSHHYAKNVSLWTN